MTDEKVSISIMPTPEKWNRYNVEVQGFKTYKKYEVNTNLELEEANKLADRYREKYPNHCNCLFK